MSETNETKIYTDVREALETKCKTDSVNAETAMKAQFDNSIEANDFLTAVAAIVALAKFKEASDLEKECREIHNKWNEKKHKLDVPCDMKEKSPELVQHLNWCVGEANACEKPVKRVKFEDAQSDGGENATEEKVVKEDKKEDVPTNETNKEEIIEIPQTQVLDQ